MSESAFERAVRGPCARLARPNNLGFNEFGGVIEGLKDANIKDSSADSKLKKTS